MLPLSSESISQIKLLQHTNAAYLFNVQGIITQNGGFCDQCVHERFVAFGLEISLLRERPPFLKHLVLHSLVINKYHYSAYIIFCLFTFTLRGRIPVSPINTYIIKFVQRGFTERATLEDLLCNTL
jgi:hypothetical protein